jgi:hypothetical protein
MKNPTLENFMSYTAEVANLDAEEQMELEEWTRENNAELEEAVIKCMTSKP